MSFNVALSGLNGASKDLEATGNNIANASTVGFKKSRVEFGDLYSGGFLSTGADTTGDGVRVQNVRQLHAQGNVTATDNGLDMAINGEGFFVLNNGGEVRYSRAGQFGLSQEGFLQNNQGMRVQGYQADADGNLRGLLGDMQIETENLPPRATQNLDGVSGVKAAFNLDSREEPPAQLFEPTPQGTFNQDSFTYTNSTRIYDSLGNPHSLNQYFVKDAGVNAWSLYVEVDNDVVNPDSADPARTWEPYKLSFDANGRFDAVNSDTVSVNVTPKDAKGLENGAEPFDFTVDLSQSTQFGTVSGLNDLSQNGYTTGRLTGLDVSNGGDIFGRYSNGRTSVLGQVALANFRNSEGLAPVGDTTWVESVDSGDAVVGKPGTGPLGQIKAGSVEESNVDLSQQLVALIIAQRNFQANAKTIETSDAITQTIINLR